jgi:Domain of unknown function (DUF4328)
MGRNRFGTGWAVAGWVVPIMNLFRPYQMAKELLRDSPRLRGTEGTGLAGLWWLLYLIGTLGGRAVNLLPTDEFDQVILADTLSVATQALWALAGVVLIALVRKVTRLQDAWFTDPDATPTPFVSPIYGDAAAVR